MFAFLMFNLIGLKDANSKMSKGRSMWMWKYLSMIRWVNFQHFVLANRCSAWWWRALRVLFISFGLYCSSHQQSCWVSAGFSSGWSKNDFWCRYRCCINSILPTNKHLRNVLPAITEVFVTNKKEFFFLLCPGVFANSGAEVIVPSFSTLLACPLLSA